MPSARPPPGCVFPELQPPSLPPRPFALSPGAEAGQLPPLLSRQLPVLLPRGLPQPMSCPQRPAVRSRDQGLCSRSPPTPHDTRRLSRQATRCLAHHSWDEPASASFSEDSAGERAAQPPFL